MTRAGKFEKVSFEQYLSDMIKSGFYPDMDAQALEDIIREQYEAIHLPRRATTGSAGYDVFSPVAFDLSPGSSIKIPTGIRVKIDEGWFLGCFPRSGMGFKYKARLANTVGIIDSDYYDSSNEGHIFIKLCNEGDKNIAVNVGDGVVQAIFIPFGVTYDDETDGIRDGGFGSTGR